MDARLGRGLFFAMWAGITAAQAYGAFEAVRVENYAVLGLIVVVAQLAKLPMTAARLRAMNRPADDAILALVPFANFGLLNQLATGRDLAPLPDGAPAEISATEAWLCGLRAAVEAWPLVVGGSLVWGVVYAGLTEIVTQAFNQYLAMGAEEAAGHLVTGQWLAGFLGVWTLATFVRRSRATPASWVLSALFAPVLLVVIGMSLRDSQLGPALVTVPLTGIGLAVASTFGAYLAALWVRIGAAADGRDESHATTLGLAMSDGLRIMGPHAASSFLVQVGMQLVIPGVYYGIVLALVDAVAVLDPQAYPLSRSMALTAGIRRRIFKLLFLGVLAYAVISTPASLLFYDGATLFGALFLPTVIDWKVWALLDAISAMAFSVVTIASVWIYRERAARAA